MLEMKTFSLEKYELVEHMSVEEEIILEDLVIFKKREGLEDMAYCLWFNQIVNLIDKYYFVLSLEEVMEIFNSRDGYLSHLR